MAETTQVDLEQIVKELQEKASRGDLSLKELEATVDEVERLFEETLRFLDQYARMVRPEEREPVEKLLRRIAPRSHHVLFEHIRRLAWSLRNHKDLQESIKKQGYRIINLARAGRKDEVAYLLARIFLAHGKSLPDPLVGMFFPSVPEDIFRACVYAFAGILAEPQKDSEKQKAEGGEG